MSETEEMSTKVISTERDELISIRHRLHAMPEISGEERETAAFIHAELVKTRPDEIHTGIGGHGLVAIYGTDRSGPQVMLRSELDALPVTEEGERPYRSIRHNRAHACGHDGHMTVILGVARYLKENRPESGRVVLLYQPAEETGEGATRMLDDSLADVIGPDRSYAFHNIPGLSTRYLAIREGPFAAASVGLRCTFTGSSSHAAYPEQGRSPSRALAELTKYIEELSYGNSNGSEHYGVATVTWIRMGEKAFGTTPGHGEIGMTLRATEDEKLEEMKQSVEDESRELGRRHSLKVEIATHEPFRATVNSPECVEIVRRAVQSSPFELHELPQPFPWSEDFGCFAEISDIAQFGIGAGEGHPHLHSESYDFPDAIIAPAVELFIQILEEEWRQDSQKM